MGFVFPVTVKSDADILSGQLAVLMGQRQHFVSAGFNGSRFMDTDMPCFCCNHSLIGVQNSIDNSRIGLGATHEEKNVCPRGAAGGTDFVSCRF